MTTALRTVTALLLIGLMVLTAQSANSAASPRGRYPGGPYNPQACPAWCYDAYQGGPAYPPPGAYPPYQQPYPYPQQIGYGYNEYSAKKKPGSG